MLDREPLSDGRTRLTFSLPLQDPPGEVSVVGSFNDWRAGEHTLVPSEGMRRVSVIVGPGDHHFRYLATGARWLDEPDADVVNEHGSMVHCPPLEPFEPAAAHGNGEAHQVGAGNGAGSRAQAAGATTAARSKRSTPASSTDTAGKSAARSTGKAKRATVRAAATTGGTTTATASTSTSRGKTSTAGRSRRRSS